MAIERIFAPGCALVLYKPDLVEKIHEFLNSEFGDIGILDTCCKHVPNLSSPTQVINICPGCDKRFRNDYELTTTISLWEILASDNLFSFPNYNGMKMSILDACPTRDQDRIHFAIRKVLEKMNIKIIEPQNTKRKSICCGDSSYGIISTGLVKQQMKKRASQMPCDDVVVYCVSCIKSLYNGGRKPHYMIDLIFNEETYPKTFEPDEWHKELDDYINLH
jgi:Fe-S oxidoreductase